MYFHIVARISFAFLLLMGFASHAWSYDLSMDDLSKIHYRPLARGEHGLDQKEDSALATRLSRIGLVDVTPAFQKMCEKLHLKHIYASADLERAIFIRSDVQLASVDQFGHLIDVESKGVLVHTRTHKHSPLVLFFLGFKRQEVNRYLLNFTSSMVSEVEPKGERAQRHHAKYLNLMNLIIQRAEAAQPCSANAESAFQKLTKSAASFINGAATCGKNIWNGFYNAVIGDNISFFSGDFIRSAYQLYGVVKTLFYGVAGEIATRFQGLNEHPELIAQFVCDSLGGIVGGAFMTVATAGMGVGIVGAARVAKIIEGLKSLLAKTDFIRTNVSRMATTSSFGKDYLDCQCTNPPPLPAGAQPPAEDGNSSPGSTGRGSSAGK